MRPLMLLALSMTDAMFSFVSVTSSCRIEAPFADK